jgi:sulfite reductase beta subunit-like hemoprotein
VTGLTPEANPAVGIEGHDVGLVAVADGHLYDQVRVGGKIEGSEEGLHQHVLAALVGSLDEHDLLAVSA